MLNDVVAAMTDLAERTSPSKHRHLRGGRVLWRDPDYRWDRPHAKDGVWDRTLQSWMERVQRRAGVEVTGNIHILRHTFCTRMAMAGVPTRVIKEMAGHASITTTERYMHLAPGSTQEAVRRLEALSFGRILVAAPAAGGGQEKTL